MEVGFSSAGTIHCWLSFGVYSEVPSGMVLLSAIRVRLIANGYTQTYGVDYAKTLSPIAKIESVRILISFPANLGWPFVQLDVKNGFLHDDLEEDVYMEQPPRFIA